MNIVHLMFLSVVLVFSALANADMLVVPPALRPAGLPAAAVVDSVNCFGVSDAGVVACSTGFKVYSTTARKYVYRYVGYMYDSVTGVTAALAPLSGSTVFNVQGITPGGDVWGMSTVNGVGVAVRQVAGVTVNLGSKGVTDCDDLGRCAYLNQIYTAATGWQGVPRALKIAALSNNGDYTAIYSLADAAGDLEHICMFRVSEVPTADIEDFCAYPALAEIGANQYPNKVVMNPSGVVAWNFVNEWVAGGNWYRRADSLRSVQGGDTLLTQGAEWVTVNAFGDVAGGDKVLHLDNSVTTIAPSGGFSSVVITGINVSGMIVGNGKYGAVSRAFVYHP